MIDTHGGALDRAIARYGGKREEWIDLSTGINPWSYPVPSLPPEAWTRLPESEALGGLEQAARAAYAVPPNMDVVAGPGTQALIQLLPSLLPPSDVAIVSPTYSEHERAWSEAGHRVRHVSEPVASDVLIVVNPNNPDGRDWHAAELSARELLIVDEAFRDTTPSRSAITNAKANAIVLRSFGKFYGLAGLRLGFAVAPPNWAEAIRRRLGPWAVSGPACEIGRRALNDHEWTAQMQDRLRAASGELARLVVARGLDVVGRTDLFVTARFPDASGMAEHLASERILVRQFEYEPTWLRFGLTPTEEARDRLDRVLARG